MGFVDTHAHLHFPDFDTDREETFKRLREAGIEFFLNVGTDVESSKKSLEFAQKYDNVYAAAGIHPNDTKDAQPEQVQQILELLKNPKVVAIGEIGLDYYRDHSPKEKQKQILNAFLDFYQILGKPLILHCRDAYSDLAEVFEARGKNWKGVMHCYSSDAETMKRFLALGFHISFAGPLTYKKNDVLREACKACPLDRLLLETDSPFLPPQSMRGKRNEPAFMIETARTAAEVHGLSVEEIGTRTTANARRLFLC